MYKLSNAVVRKSKDHKVNEPWTVSAHHFVAVFAILCDQKEAPNSCYVS